MQADKRIYPLEKIRWLSFKRAATLLLSEMYARGYLPAPLKIRLLFFEDLQ